MVNMVLDKILTSVSVFSFCIIAVSGCGRLKCYKCNSQDSPFTCGEDNFNADFHSDYTTSGSKSTSIDGGTSCVRGWAMNDKGTYYYRDKTNEFENDGCETPQKCFCNSDLCNSKGSRDVSIATMTTTLFCSLLAIAYVQNIFV